MEPPWLLRHRVCLGKWKPVLEALKDVVLQTSAMESVLEGHGVCCLACSCFFELACCVMTTDDEYKGFLPVLVCVWPWAIHNTYVRCCCMYGHGPALQNVCDRLSLDMLGSVGKSCGHCLCCAVQTGLLAGQVANHAFCLPCTFWQQKTSLQFFQCTTKLLVSCIELCLQTHLSIGSQRLSGHVKKPA